MDNSFETNLTPAQIERLALLMEECAEVQQIIGKILRHGYNSHSPFDEFKLDNRLLLCKELGHLLLAANIMIDKQDVDSQLIRNSCENKSKTINKWLHFNKVG